MSNPNMRDTQTGCRLSLPLFDWLVNKALECSTWEAAVSGKVRAVSCVLRWFACEYTVCIRNCFLEHSFLTQGNFRGLFVSQRFISEGKLSQILDWDSHPVVIVASLKTQGQILVAYLSHHRSYVASTTSGAGAKPLKHYRCVVKVFIP